MSSNPAYVQWVEMTKDGEEKLVHPGNVDSHLRAGWNYKNPPAAEETGSDPAEKAADQETPEAAAKRAKADAKAAAKKAKADPKE